MNKSVLNNSILLIGPKAVGKSLIADKLSLKQDSMPIFSSDKLENYAMMFTEGDFRNVDEIIEVVKSSFSNEKALKKYKGNPEQIIKQNEKYVSDYINSLKFYATVVDFRKLRTIIYQTMSLLRNNGQLSLRQMLSVMQYQKIQMLEYFFENLQTPVVADFGADVGAVIELLPKEKSQIERMYGIKFSKIENAQKQFFKKFRNVVYLSPGIDYKEKIDPRSNDEHNKIYCENKDSYVAFAKLEESMNGTFFDIKNSVFKNDNDYDYEVLFKKNSLMDKSNIENICDQILSEIEMIKGM